MRRVEQDVEAAVSSGKNHEADPNFGGDCQQIRLELLSQVPMSPEEIQELVTADRLSQMSLREYISLLKRLPPRFITHVTRQGVRDNFTHHSGGYGEFNNGFVRILESRELNCELQTLMKGDINKVTVKRVLKEVLRIPGDEARTIEEARALVDTFLNRRPAFSQFVPNEFTDKTALHVAIDYVGDHYYGAERKNDIFVVWPGALAASQYQMAGQQFRIPTGMKLEDWQLHNQFNDFWLKTKGEMGHLPLDAGIVFIPKSVRVDPQTGSRYEIVDNQPVANSEQLEAMKRLVFALKAQGDVSNICRSSWHLQEVLEKVQRLEKEVSEGSVCWHFGLKSKADQLAEARGALSKVQTSLQPFFDLAKESGISDERFFSLFEDPNGAWQSLQWFLGQAEEELPFNVDDPNSGWIVQAHIEDNLRTMGMQYQLAKKTVPAEEYWENYFAMNGNKPSKIVYYDADSPTDALNEFKQEIGLNEEQSPVDLRDAFKENFITTKEMSDDESAQRRAFQEISEEVIAGLFTA